MLKAVSSGDKNLSLKNFFTKTPKAIAVGGKVIIVPVGTKSLKLPTPSKHYWQSSEKAPENSNAALLQHKSGSKSECVEVDIH